MSAIDECHGIIDELKVIIFARLNFILGNIARLEERINRLEDSKGGEKLSIEGEHEECVHEFAAYGTWEYGPDSLVCIKCGVEK